MRKTLLFIAVGALLAAPALAGIARRAGASRTVTILVDGQRVQTDSVTGSSLTGLLVQETPMLPVRLLDQTLRGSLDLHLMPWKIVHIETRRPTEFPFGASLDFRAGDTTAYGSAPAIGGSASIPLKLPVAPVIVDGHFYVPAEPTLETLGFTARWDAETRTLRIMTK